MSDVNTLHPQGHALAQSDMNLGVTAGAMLRQAREAAGLHVAALAVSMKVPVKKLEALEADQLDTLLDAVFVRALASSVCRALKIDPIPILDRLPQNRVPRLDGGEVGINAPFHAPGQTPGLFVPAYFAKPGFILVLALLLGAAVLFFFPEMKTSEHLTLTEKVIPVPLPEVAALATDPAQRTDGASTTAVDATAAAAAPNTADLSTASQTASPPVAMPQTVTLPVTASIDANAPVIEPAAAKAVVLQTGLVVFKAKGSSWVEVVDAKSVVQMRRLFAAGETGAAIGSLPLSVVVGRADAMDVEVRGKPFDFTAVSKDGVARFEVK